MKIRLSHKRFLLAALLLLAILVNLGFWQIHRYHDKKNLLQTYQRQQHWQALAWEDFLQAQHKQYRRINVKGHYLNRGTLLLDNRWYNDRIGYEVLTPFKVENQAKLLLVNRGWVPAARSRAELPTIAPVFGLQIIRGYIVVPSESGFLFGHNVEPGAMPLRRIQQVNVANIEGLIKQPFYPYVLRLAPEEPHGFVREWQLVTVQPDRHLGYAVQWFAMALALMIATILFLRRQTGRAKCA